MAKSFQNLRSKMSPQHQARAEARTEALLAQMALQELRQSLNVTQKQLADLLDINQAAVSKMESQEDIRVSTLFQYIQAVGGKLKLVARFGDQEIVINQFKSK